MPVQIAWWPTVPILALLGTAIVVLVVGLVGSRRQEALPLFLTILGMGATFWMIAQRVAVGEATFNAFLQYDAIGRLGALVVLAAGMLIALVSLRTVRLYDLPGPEYYALLVFAVFGMVVLSLGAELITLLLAVEIVAVSIYILVGLRGGCSRSAEASMKYFILGAFSSAFLVFGIAFLYGGSNGATTIERIGVTMSRSEPAWATAFVSLGLVLLLAAFAFKLTLAPFHLYAADVYEGAPTPVAALLATGVKAAGFVAVVHVLAPFHGQETQALRAFSRDVANVLWVLAVLSIVIGNTVAILQRNIKRMLAYSSIAHSGYLLIGVLVLVTGTVERAEIEMALLVYLIAYVLMNVTAFGVALVLGERGEQDVGDYAGLARRSPVLALTMAAAMLSLTGIPATAGFVGKFFVFATAVKGAGAAMSDVVRDGLYAVVIIAVLGSVVSAYYYLRVIVYMYMHEPKEDAAQETIGLVPSIGLALAVIPILVFGVLPHLLLRVLEVL